MNTPLLTKSFRNTAVAIAGFLVIKAATDGLVALATAATDPLVGAAGSMGAPASGVLDIDVAGFSEVCVGGDITFGDPLTANASGKAIKAVPTAGAAVRIIGFAMSDGAADDIIPFQVAPGVIATPA